MKIEHDFHLHTSLSFCADKCATLEGYVDIAKNFGLKKIGIANHFWDSKIPRIDTYYKTKYDVGFYDNQDFNHISKIKPEIEKFKDSGIKIYFGAEAEYDPIRHGVGITEEVAEQLEFLIVPNSHTHITMPMSLYEPYEKHVQFMIDAYNDILDCPVSKYVTAMAHPFTAVACPYSREILFDLISDDVFKKLFSETADKGIAVEINTDDFAKDEISKICDNKRIRMYNIAKTCGCKFLFGSDAHHNEREHKRYMEILGEITKIINLTEADILDIAK